MATMLLAASFGLQAAEVAGRVLDSVTGEPLRRMKVALTPPGAETVTDDAGAFAFLSVAEGKAILRVTGVGYRPFQLEVEVPGSVLEIMMPPDTLRRSESIQVAAGAFVEETPSTVGLAGNELKNLASVLADDPLRAVQGLPGVAANDDFQSQISLRGAGFSRIGVYLDGVLLHSPYHTVQGEPNSASLTIFNGDMLESVDLHAGAPPVRFSDRTAGALDIRSRDGDKKRFSVRGTLSASNAGAMLEGPIRGGKGSWLATARKSYLQYIIRRTSDDPSLGFGFSDAQGRVQYDVARAWNVSLGVIHGESGLDRTGAQVGLNAIYRSDYNFTLTTLGARYLPGRAFLATNRIAFLRERYRNTNRESRALGASGYGEWVWNGDATWQQATTASLQFGGVARRVRDDGFADLLGAGNTFIRYERFRGSALRSGGYLQQTLTSWEGKVTLIAGGRVDGHSATSSVGHAVSPYASVSVQPLSGTRVSLSWGQYVQFPEIAQLFNTTGSRRLLPERAMHVDAAVEQRLGGRTRLRVQVYNRQDRDLLARPGFDFRLLNGRIVGRNLGAPILNSQRAYARGGGVFLQRRTANGFTGWVGYSWGTARVRDGAVNRSFPSDFDQRHTVNIFGSYRLRPTVNLSTKWLYGSGFPLRGYFRGTRDEIFLSEQRNQLRIPAYQRTDLRINKAFVRKRWQLTLFAEVINLTNHDNVRFDDINSIDGRTGRVRLGLEKTFPILPSAGMVIEF